MTYNNFFPNISNVEFSCSDDFNFVEGHIKLPVHIKQCYVSLSKLHRNNRVLWLLSPEVGTFAHEAFALFLFSIVDVQMELDQEISGQKRQRDKPIAVILW